MKKKRLYMVAANTRYGTNAFVPLAAGLMWGYARKFPEIEYAYELCGMLYLKERIELAIAKLEAPDLVCFSSYIWSHEWNKQLAKAIKEKWPRCATLVGGVQVQDESPAVLEECPQFDFAIYGEGEGAFADFLRVNDIYGTLLCGEVGSLVWRDLTRDGQIIVNPRHAETPLEDIPSPYLDGLFDKIVTDDKFAFQALQETNRGCVFRCDFCSWGAASLDKMRKFPMARVLAEYEWMAKHKIEFLYNADSNFGMYKRDIELTEALVKTKADHGYPVKFRAAYMKNSNDTVFNISKILNDAGMSKATTLALQSMDEAVLGNIQRKNIKYDKLAELSARYEAAGISTYAEIIVGLPGETLQSYIDGLDALLEAGQHDSISIYLCMILNNTKMASEEYRRLHGIETVQMKALLYHGTPEPDVVEEIQETVVATSTMSRDELTQAVLYGWLLQALHGFGLTQHYIRSAVEAGQRKSYSVFYSSLMLFAANHPETVLGRAYARVKGIWEKACAGESWDTVDALYGDVSWPPEELMFLDIACESDRFYDEVGGVLIGADTGLRNAWEQQRAMFIPPAAGFTIEYAREAVWFGRKGSGRKLRLREEKAL